MEIKKLKGDITLLRYVEELNAKCTITRAEALAFISI